MYDKDISTILWMLYEWEDNWYGYKTLAKYTHISIKKIKQCLKYLKMIDFVYTVHIYVRNMNVQGYFLKDKIRMKLDNYDTNFK